MNGSKFLRSAAVTGVLAVGLMGASALPASADSIQTRCNYGECYRVRCDDWGRDCVRMGYYNSDYYRGRRHWVCDYDGEGCHWAYNDGYRYYDRDRYYDRPAVSFGMRF
ncbi:MAG: hypothetical protein JOZ55_04360 [Alphaproteobacteria bacterium]|nr:hypothetical protein [Alphaproteobacteria bacterium]